MSVFGFLTNDDKSPHEYLPTYSTTPSVIEHRVKVHIGTSTAFYITCIEGQHVVEITKLKKVRVHNGAELHSLTEKDRKGAFYRYETEMDMKGEPIDDIMKAALVYLSNIANGVSNTSSKLHGMMTSADDKAHVSPLMKCGTLVGSIMIVGGVFACELFSEMCKTNPYGPAMGILVAAFISSRVPDRPVIRADNALFHIRNISTLIRKKQLSNEQDYQHAVLSDLVDIVKSCKDSNRILSLLVEARLEDPQFAMHLHY